MNVFKLSKTINAPMKFVYDWCTDFAAVQAAVPTAPRKVVQTSRKRIIFIEIYEGADGGQKAGVDIITLRPPRSWRMEYIGEENDEFAEYTLSQLSKERTRVEASFRNRWKGSFSLSTPQKRKIESDLWDRYAAAVELAYSKTSR